MKKYIILAVMALGFSQVGLAGDKYGKDTMHKKEVTNTDQMENPNEMIEMNPTAAGDPLADFEDEDLFTSGDD